MANDVECLVAELHGSAVKYRYLNRPILADLLDRAANALTRPEGARVPEGWKMVPWKPTARMLEVGDSLCSRVGGGQLQKVQYPAGVGPEDVYECMVAAAPDVTFSSPQERQS